MLAQDDSVQQRPQLSLHRRRGQANKIAAEHPCLQPHLRRRAQDPGAVGWVGRNIDHVRIGRPQRPQNRREIRGGWRIACIIHGRQPGRLGVDPSAVGRIAGELGIRPQDREGLRLRVHAHRQVEEAVREGQLRLRPHRHHGEHARIVVFAVDRQCEQTEVQLVVARHDRHCRRGHIGRIAGQHEVHVIDVQQLDVDAGHVGRVALRIVADQLDRTPQQSARRVDLFGPDFRRQDAGFADRRQPAGLRFAKPDRNRLHRSGRRNPANDQGRHGQPMLYSVHESPLPDVSRALCRDVSKYVPIGQRYSWRGM